MSKKAISRRLRSDDRLARTALETSVRVLDRLYPRLRLAEAYAQVQQANAAAERPEPRYRRVIVRELTKNAQGVYE